MALQPVTFQASPSSEPQTVYVPEDAYTIESFLVETQGITNFSNITVEVDGEPATLSATVAGGMEICISQKKTDSGLLVRA